MPAPNLAIVFGGILAGGIVLIYGGRSVSDAFTGGSSSTAAPASSSNSSTSSSTDRSLMQQIGAEHGWTGAQIDDWENILGTEDASGSLTATNATSGAYGDAQFIGGASEYAQYGGNTSSSEGELTAMANYIAQRYGDPSEAWSFHLAHGWY